MLLHAAVTKNVLVPCPGAAPKYPAFQPALPIISVLSRCHYGLSERVCILAAECEHRAGEAGLPMLHGVVAGSGGVSPNQYLRQRIESSAA